MGRTKATGAGGAEGAEALSGLARAFFYAGAHALLVSHWAVDSDSTVNLVKTAISTMSIDKSVGRAEALRRAMVALIEHGEPQGAHPAYWAPFVVVGEGRSDLAAAAAVTPPAVAPTSIVRSTNAQTETSGSSGLAHRGLGVKEGNVRSMRPPSRGNRPTRFGCR